MKSQFDISDAMVISGWAMVFAGVWRIYQPAAIVLCGLSVLALGFGLAKAKRAKN